MVNIMSISNQRCLLYGCWLIMLINQGSVNGAVITTSGTTAGMKHEMVAGIYSYKPYSRRSNTLARSPRRRFDYTPSVSTSHGQDIVTVFSRSSPYTNSSTLINESKVIDTVMLPLVAIPDLDYPKSYHTTSASATMEHNIQRYLESIHLSVLQWERLGFDHSFTPFVVTHMFRVGRVLVHMFTLQHQLVHQFNRMTQKYAHQGLDYNITELLQFEHWLQDQLNRVRSLTFGPHVDMAWVDGDLARRWLSYHPSATLPVRFLKSLWTPDITDVLVFQPECYSLYLFNLWEDVIRPFASPDLQAQFEEVLRISALTLAYEVHQSQPPLVIRGLSLWKDAGFLGPASSTWPSTIRDLEMIMSHVTQKQHFPLLEEELKFLTYKSVQFVLDFVQTRESSIRKYLRGLTSLNRAHILLYTTRIQFGQFVEIRSLRDASTFYKLTTPDPLVRSPRPSSVYEARHVEESPMSLDLDAIIASLNFSIIHIDDYLSSLYMLDSEDHEFRTAIHQVSFRLLHALKSIAALTPTAEVPRAESINRQQKKSSKKNYIINKVAYRNPGDYLIDPINLQGNIVQNHQYDSEFSRKVAYEVYRMFILDAPVHQDIQAFLVLHTIRNPIEPHLFLGEMDIIPAFEPFSLGEFMNRLIQFICAAHPEFIKDKLLPLLVTLYLISDAQRPPLYPTLEIQVLIKRVAIASSPFSEPSANAKTLLEQSFLDKLFRWSYRAISFGTVLPPS